MCYYDQFRMACHCYKWGNFRQHCTREYRTGETCGMKLVMGTYQLEDECKLCQKIRTKYGRIQKEEERIKRWRKESGRKASIELSESAIQKLEGEVNELLRKREENMVSL